MVAINLLKGPQAHTARRRARAELFVGIFALACTVSVWGWVVVDGGHAIQRLERDIQEKQGRLALMEKTQDQVLALKEQRKTIVAEQKQLMALTNDPNGPIRLLSVLSQVVDPLDVWLRHLQTTEKKVVLSGFALSREDVVKLAKHLEAVLGPVNVFETQADAAQPARLRFSMNMDAHG